MACLVMATDLLQLDTALLCHISYNNILFMATVLLQLDPDILRHISYNNILVLIT